MNWLKENWFKLSITIAIVLVGISVFSYFVIFLPQKERIILEGGGIKLEQEDYNQIKIIFLSNTRT